MIFPRKIALEAAEDATDLLKAVGGIVVESGDLRMKKPTLERIELIVRGIRGPEASKALAGGGWRKLRSGRGPLVFLIDTWPKLSLCVAREPNRDLLGEGDQGNAEVLQFMRTGTRLFQDDIACRARERGFVLKASQGLVSGGRLVATTEAAIFAALELPVIPPEERYSLNRIRAA